MQRLLSQIDENSQSEDALKGTFIVGGTSDVTASRHGEKSLSRTFVIGPKPATTDEVDWKDDDTVCGFAGAAIEEGMMGSMISSRTLGMTGKQYES